jgi:hypothetical protein
MLRSLGSRRAASTLEYLGAGLAPVDEEGFVLQLATRALLLDEGFQARCAHSLCPKQYSCFFDYLNERLEIEKEVEEAKTETNERVQQGRS